MGSDKFEEDLYRAMRYQVYGVSSKNFPIPLLMEWEKVRMQINPNAKKLDLLKYAKKGGEHDESEGISSAGWETEQAD